MIALVKLSPIVKIEWTDPRVSETSSHSKHAPNGARVTEAWDHNKDHMDIILRRGQNLNQTESKCVYIKESTSGLLQKTRNPPFESTK